MPFLISETAQTKANGNIYIGLVRREPCQLSSGWTENITNHARVFSPPSRILEIKIRPEGCRIALFIIAHLPFRSTPTRGQRPLVGASSKERGSYLQRGIFQRCLAPMRFSARFQEPQPRTWRCISQELGQVCH
jgi:hypothetical protein